MQLPERTTLTMAITLKLLRDLVAAAYQDELAGRAEVDDTAVVSKPTLGRCLREHLPVLKR